MVPDLLREARGHLNDATVAMDLIHAASDDPTRVKQYAFETTIAAQHLYWSLQDYLTMLRVDELTDEQVAIHAALRRFELEVMEAQGGGPF